jgi:nucleoside-diphosphate-sugar epimerase
MKFKILVTGAAGYIGSMLTTELVRLGYFVRAIDIQKYDKNSLSHLFSYNNFQFINDDISKETVIKKYVKDVDFIIPLAALVGAPLCEKFKNKAKKINIDSIKIILKYVKNNQKIIYPTTNSGYGIGQKNKFCDENSPLNPISLYGATKAKAEKLIMEHNNSICFRLATVFGFSYRMRTDLLVNDFVMKAVKYKKLFIYEPHFRRNYVHIKDVVNAFIFAINNFNRLRNNIYNLGLSSANLTKISLAKKIKIVIKKLRIVIIKNVSIQIKEIIMLVIRKLRK